MSRSECFIFSSDPRNGAVNRSADGSRFTIQFNDPFWISANAVGATLSVIRASIWNNSPNVSAVIGNNTFQITDVNGTHTVTVSDGLYDVDTLVQELAYQFDNLLVNRPYFPFSSYFRFSANESTNKVIITFLNEGQTGAPEIKWANTALRTVLGFESTSPGKPTIPYSADHEHSIESPDTPKFNTYNSFVIHSDIVDTGIRINGQNYQNIIGVVPISSSVGELTSYVASDPVPFALCNNLIGPSAAKWSISVWLTSEFNQPLDTRGEYYEVIVLIKWTETEQEQNN